MGCTGSTLRCCSSGGKRRRKAKKQREQAAQELTVLGTENANATLFPEDGKEKEALQKEQTESITFLQSQEEEQLKDAGQEEKQLKDAGQAETRRNTQDMSTQVEKEKYLELEEQLDALKREHTEALQELQRTHEQEKMLLVESHHKTQAALQEMIQELNSQLKSFQETMKRVEASLLNTEYKKHIQKHGIPSPFWEQELESLHFVIEMKNERIHGMQKKLMNLETVVGGKLLLEEKLKTLQQENEDLQVRSQNHLAMARQLSEELLAARGALEKEKQLRERLRREKEELLYRMLNGGDGSAFPMAAGEVSLIAT